MNTPNVVHPRVFEINGIYFQIISYSKITDKQAATMAMTFYKSKKFKKKDKGKTFKVVTVL